jgi:hypothetical protein
MRVSILRIKIVCFWFCIIIFALPLVNYAEALEAISYLKLRESPPLPESHFSPSNAKTEDGKLIPSGQFISAERCVSCHQETHAQWSESLHRNAGREPFY